MEPLYAAMALAFPKLEAAIKDRNNPAFKSRYADLGAVMAAIKPALAEHGLFFWQISHEQKGGACVETILAHSSGAEKSLGTVFIPASKSDAHGYGSALTYARRYALQTAFGIPAEDDDGNSAVKSAPVEPVFISDDQAANIQALAEEVGADMTRFLKHMKVRTISSLPASQYHAAIQALETKRKAAA
jgi:hypothetical protein